MISVAITVITTITGYLHIPPLRVGRMVLGRGVQFIAQLNRGASPRKW
jgi:hypothetical protein